jgi:hypothetical protein
MYLPWTSNTLCSAFEGSRLIASGRLESVAAKVKRAVDGGTQGPVLIFDDQTSGLIEVDFRGTVEEVLGRLPAAPDAEALEERRGPGRPKLGVVGREVTLLPRHWEWLNAQPGGASVALRKLVEQARRASEGQDRMRSARDSAYRFISAMAGNEPGFEEAARALFAGDRRKFEILAGGWPEDVGTHAVRIAAAAFPGEG